MFFSKNLIIRFAVNTLALELTAIIIKDIQLNDLKSVLFTSLVLGFLNTFLKPFFIFLTLPLNIVTLGGFTFIINAFMLYCASIIVPGFHISSFYGGIIGAFILSIISFALNTLIKKNDF